MPDLEKFKVLSIRFHSSGCEVDTGIKVRKLCTYSYLFPSSLRAIWSKSSNKSIKGVRSWYILENCKIVSPKRDIYNAMYPINPIIIDIESVFLPFVCALDRIVSETLQR